MSGISISYPPFSAPCGSDSPRASMSSGAAATTRGPPTCGATARSTPRTSSGLAPSSRAFATCHAYEAGGASSAISAAILHSAYVRGSSPDISRPTSRSPIACSSVVMSPAERPDSVCSVSVATAVIAFSFSVRLRLRPWRRHVGVRHQLAPERHERHRDQLEVGDRERDADDRDEEGDARDQVREREPPAREQEPQDVPDHGPRPGARLAFHVPAERPEREACELCGLNPERDRDDEDEHDDRREQVAERQPEAGEDY